MHGIVDRVLIGHEAEIAELGADVRLGDALDGVLVVESITNQIGDRAELETVLARELFQIRTTCHRAVLVEDLDDHGRRLDTRQTREITARSEEHTSELQSLMRISYAVFCLKKKNKHTQQKKCISKNTK